MPQGLAIHVIDDDEHVRESLEVLLVAHGYQVLGYPTAEHFLAFLPALAGPALAVVDYDLPGIDGVTLLLRLAGRLPVILVTGRIDDASQAAREAGALACLHKPFDPATLLSVIARLQP